MKDRAITRRLNANKEGARFEGEDIGGYDFKGRLLRGITFVGCSFDEASFAGCYLRDAVFIECKLLDVDFEAAFLEDSNFRGSVLRRCDFTRADLDDANFQGATLELSTFHHASLHGAIFEGATLPWDQHDILAELLRRAAMNQKKNRTARLMVAGLVSVGQHLCWANFLHIRHEEREWALNVLAEYVQDCDGAPAILHKLAKKRQPPVGEAT